MNYKLLVKGGNPYKWSTAHNSSLITYNSYFGLIFGNPNHKF